MPLEMGLWRVDDKPVRIDTAAMPLESRLEQLIEDDPTILGEQLLMIGRQVPTAFGGFIDLLAIDVEGVVHVLELKRERTPREVVAQVLDYGSWAQTLGQEEIRSLFANYRPGSEFDAAFADRFGDAPPEDLNTSHRLTVIASAADPATERIVTYLATGFGVPVNVAFFRYFTDGDRAYLARTWLLDETVVPAQVVKGKTGGNRERWNGQDWYVSFGEEDSSRSWDDARRYGFVSAGGGEWFSRTLKSLPVGARVFVCIPKRGYVGVGEVTGGAVPADQATLTVDGVVTPFRKLDLQGRYTHESQPADGADRAEYVVPVTWVKTVGRTEAVWKSGCSPTRTLPANCAAASRCWRSLGRSTLWRVEPCGLLAGQGDLLDHGDANDLNLRKVFVRPAYSDQDDGAPCVGDVGSVWDSDVASPCRGQTLTACPPMRVGITNGVVGELESRPPWQPRLIHTYAPVGVS